MRQINAEKLYEELKNYPIESSTGEIRFYLGNLDIVVEDTDIVGKCIESWLGEWMTNKEVYFSRPDNSQEFPDYYLSANDKEHDLLEVKTFIYDNSPAFDIANFESYCDSIKSKAYRLDADYLIFGYRMGENGTVSIEKIWLKKIWEIAGTSERYPLKTQIKRDIIYNIRPNTNFKKGSPPPFNKKEDFLKAIYETLVKYSKYGIKKADEWKKSVINNYESYTNKTLDF